MRIAIVTGADTAFFEMLRTLILSLEGHAPFSDIDLCVQDFGLSDGDRDWLQSHAQAVAAPARVVEADPKRKFKPPHIADTSRPFLRETFPGYDMYLWMDADTWVQDWAAIELYMAAAESGALAITPEIDRAYAPTPSKIRRHPLPSRATLKREISFNNYRNGFGFKAATTYWNLPVFNSGVLALRHDAPHWDHWATHFRSGLNRTATRMCQWSLNYSIYHEGLPVHPLPSWCNWVCHRALPMADSATGRLVEPFLPHRDIGVVHYIDPIFFKQSHKLATREGGTIERTLRPAGP